MTNDSSANVPWGRRHCLALPRRMRFSTKDNDEEFYMQRMFLALKKVVRKSVLVLGLIGLLVSGLFISQPSLAATQNQKLVQQQNREQDSQDANQREQAYEEQIEAAKDPDKIYEENLKEERKENPGGGVVQKTVEGTKDLVNKVTGND